MLPWQCKKNVALVKLPRNVVNSVPSSHRACSSPSSVSDICVPDCQSSTPLPRHPPASPPPPLPRPLYVTAMRSPSPPILQPQPLMALPKDNWGRIPATTREVLTMNFLIRWEFHRNQPGIEVVERYLSLWIENLTNPTYTQTKVEHWDMWSENTIWFKLLWVSVSNVYVSDFTSWWQKLITAVSLAWNQWCLWLIFTRQPWIPKIPFSRCEWLVAG